MSGANEKYIEFGLPNKVRLLKFKSDISRIFIEIDAVYLPVWATDIEHVIISLHTDGAGQSTISVLKLGYDLLNINYEYPYLYIESKATYSLRIKVKTSPYYDIDGTLL